MKDQEPVKILYITQEINPYIKETEIADICRQFPQHTIEKGCEIRTFMPCFGHINERRNQLHEVIRLSGMNLIIDDTDHPLIMQAIEHSFPLDELESVLFELTEKQKQDLKEQ